MTTSLELSKKLAKAGLKIEAEWYYCQGEEYKENFKTYIAYIELFRYSEALTDDSLKILYSSPDSDDLINILPRNISIKQYDEKDSTRFQVEFNEGYMKLKKYKYDNSLPEALGKMCLWLLENGYHYNPETKMIERERGYFKSTKRQTRL